MSKLIVTTLMLVCSNIFMTFAWYGHLKNYNDKPWIVAAVISWGIALFEYLIQVPANRIGHQAMSLGQLKILQEEKVEYENYMMKVYNRIKAGVWGGATISGAVTLAYAVTHNVAAELILNFPSFTFPTMVAVTTGFVQSRVEVVVMALTVKGTVIDHK